MDDLRIRDADPARDAAACAAIYAPHVEGSAVSFEERAPDAAELAARIERYRASHVWLVAEREGRVVGYAYAFPFQERPAYRWSAGVSVYAFGNNLKQYNDNDTPWVVGTTSITFSY